MRALRRISMLTILLLVMALTFTVTGLARKGPWVDEIVVIEEPSDAAAISRLEVRDIDVYAYTVSNPEIFERVLDNPDLDYQISFGSYNELTFNPVGPVFPGTGKLNPFAVPKIREAMNILIDREHIAQEIYGGMAVPKFFPITAAFPDYARYAEVARVLELKYAHDPVLADEIISAEMQKIGAIRLLGKWMYEGEPVEIIPECCRCN
ncbi:MAG TPA: ABC transporter substrate-binding protein, partial [Firmicutes bacterium]|nr:ABC transporter substrate-binding protein [Bacillota bacterium]